MTKHLAWTDIENFHSLRKSLQKYPHLAGEGALTYVSKVKLHGTNAGIRIDPDGTVTAFSRSNVITPASDNLGFARWVNENVDEWRKLASQSLVPQVIWGEWCGPGIMKGVAVNKLPHKVFAVFAMTDIVTGDVGEVAESIWWLPTDLEIQLSKLKMYHHDLYVVPVVGYPMVIDPLAPAEVLEPVLQKINQLVADVEKCDPFAKKVFGVEGIGEGVVCYPLPRESYNVGTANSSYQFFKNLVFKAKGEAHQVVAKTRAVQAEPTKVEGLAEFVSLVLTTPRLEQGARALAGGELTFDMKNIGQFLAWISRDVDKETSAELEASGLDRKRVLREVQSVARLWYLEQSRKP